ncbi:pcif1, partial [Symbiodinium sp. CCMP2592]
MGVSCELFASPLNCYFAQFYSAFPDVDSAFGSRGSFFEAATLPEGSYEVGPPYTEEVMDLMAKKLLALLRGSGERPLSFVVFVPDWGDACTALGLMSGEEFKPFRHFAHGSYILARGREHEYISGVQFFHDSGADASRRYYDVPHGTRVYVLQNSAGATRWPFTE